MSGGDHAGTPCPTCGTKYRWKPELASRKIHCAKCGDTIRMPAEAGGTATLVRKADPSTAKPTRKTPDTPTAASGVSPAAAPDEDLPVLTEETAPRADTPAPEGQPPLEGPDVFATGEAPNAAPDAPAEDDLSLGGAANADADIYALAGADDIALAPQPAPAAPPPKAAPTKSAAPPIKAAKPAAPKPDEAPGCPSCGNPVKPGAVICMNCGFNIAAGSKVKTEVTTGDGDAEDAPQTGKGPLSRIKGLLAKRGTVSKGPPKGGDILDPRAKFINLHLPLILIGLGFIYQLATAYPRENAKSPLSLMFGHGMTPMTIALIQVSVGIVFMIPFLFIMVAALKILHVEYGPLHQALLKAAAIGWGPGAVASLVFMMIGGFLGAVAGFLTWVVAYFGLIMVLFSIDLVKAILVFLLNIVLLIAAGMALGGLIMIALRIFLH